MKQAKKATKVTSQHYVAGPVPRRFFYKKKYKEAALFSSYEMMSGDGLVEFNLGYGRVDHIVCN